MRVTNGVSSNHFKRTTVVAAFMLGLCGFAPANTFFFSAITDSPGLFCNNHSTTAAVSCISDSGVEGRAAISGSPITNGFSFTESFDMGPDLFQSFGNLDFGTDTLQLDTLFPLGFYTMTVLEQGTCTSNIQGACDGFGFEFSQYPPQQPGTFTASPQLETFTGPVFAILGDYRAEFFSNHTVSANENTNVAGSLQIESVTLSSTLVPEPRWTGLALMISVGGLSLLRLRQR
jgi:hypothetical protein